MNKPKIIVVLGPTASGKSSLAVEIAQKFNGEIISADSRQVYKGLNIGTGKVNKKEMKGVPHHLLDVISPQKQFSAAEYKKRAQKKLEEIIEKKKVPIICGGTGLYIDTLLGTISIPEVAPNLKLREKLEKQSTSVLFSQLQKLDPERAETIDAKNPRRLIRAIEIATALGKVPSPSLLNSSLDSTISQYDVFKIGIKLENQILQQRINERLKERIKKGMITEAKKLHQNGLSFKRMRSLGLEYGRLADFLQKKITQKEMTTLLQKEIWHYAKRQMTWFQRDKSIIWISKMDSSLQYSLQKFLSF